MSDRTIYALKKVSLKGESASIETNTYIELDSNVDILLKSCRIQLQCNQLLHNTRPIFEPLEIVLKQQEERISLLEDKLKMMEVYFGDVTNPNFLLIKDKKKETKKRKLEELLLELPEGEEHENKKHKSDQ